MTNFVDTKPRAWRKGEVASLKKAIDHWWLFHSMYLRPGVTKAQVFESMPADERKRIVIVHFRGFANMLSERSEKSRATADHARTNPHVWGKASEEIIDRFQRLSREDGLASAKSQAMVDRVMRDGLPPELEPYVPAD